MDAEPYFMIYLILQDVAKFQVRKATIILNV